jgi:hypothetical protein
MEIYACINQFNFIQHFLTCKERFRVGEEKGLPLQYFKISEKAMLNFMYEVSIIVAT